MNPNTQRTFDNPEFGSIRTLETHDGKILFCGKDVATALGYKNTKKAIADHCKKDGVTKCDLIDKMGRRQNASFLTEGNVYRLITHSKLPNAEKFESWLFDEVLPVLRANKLFMKDPTEWVKHLTNRQDCGRIENKNKRSFEWYENISALALGDTSINTYAKALDLADYSITQLSALVKYLLRKSARNEEFIMNHTQINLDELKSHLPEYLATVTQHRKGKQYNCPFCGSGTGARTSF